MIGIKEKLIFEKQLGQQKTNTPTKQKEKIEQKKVRFRTLGCYPLTAAVESSASSVEEIIIELLETKYSERQGRLIDNDQIGSMEKKKQEGYF